MLQFKVDLRIIVTKGYSTFPKAPGLETYQQIQFSVITKILRGGRSYPTAEVQSASSTAPADRANL